MGWHIISYIYQSAVSCLWAEAQDNRKHKQKKHLTYYLLSLSLPSIFEDQGSGYPLKVSKVTLWTGPVKILTKGPLGSNLSHTQEKKHLKDGLIEILKNIINPKLERRSAVLLLLLLLLCHAQATLLGF